MLKNLAASMQTHTSAIETQTRAMESQTRALQENGSLIRGPTQGVLGLIQRTSFQTGGAMHLPQGRRNSSTQASEYMITGGDNTAVQEDKGAKDNSGSKTKGGH